MNKILEYIENIKSYANISTSIYIKQNKIESSINDNNFIFILIEESPPYKLINYILNNNLTSVLIDKISKLLNNNINLIINENNSIIITYINTNLDHTNLDRFKLTDISEYPINEILYNLSYNEIIDFCLVNMKYSEICNDDKFWRQKFIHDFKYNPSSEILNMKKYYKIKEDSKLELVYNDAEQTEYSFINGTRKNVHQIVGIPFDLLTLKKLVENVNLGQEFVELEDFYNYESNIINDYLYDQDFIYDKELFKDFNIKLYKQPCCLFDNTKVKYILGKIININDNWSDYSILNLFYLDNINEDVLLESFKNITDGNKEYALEILKGGFYPWDPTTPKTFPKISNFMLEYTQLVLRDKQLTPDEFLKSKDMTKSDLYNMYFNRIYSSSILELTNLYNQLPIDQELKISNIALSDDCESCT